MADIGERAEFSFVRYAQCWEDADILLRALQIKPGGRYLSIASGGENSFSMLAQGAKVIAVDLSLPQLAVTDLKRAAYARLEYDDFLTFLGARPMDDRRELYKRALRPYLQPEHRVWLDKHLPLIDGGILHCGKFESYFALFRTRVLPLTHSSRTIEALLVGNPERAAREEFYNKHWNNLRYKALFRIFFSRRVMGRHGRDTAFFQHVRGGVADRIKQRVKAGLIEVNGPDNPYLHYILTGNYGDILPHALRKESFDAIRASLDNLTLLRAPVESTLSGMEDSYLAGCNLSDIFEYMTMEQMNELYTRLLDKAKPHARLVYWNMLAPRRADPELFGARIRGLYKTGAELLKHDKAFFYSRLIIEEKR